jgi:hypothetical protein
MPKEEFENWLDIDNNAEVVATMTVLVICQAVANDKSILAEESESTSKEEEILEAPPTNAQMRALQILRRGVQHKATNCQRHYEYEQFIEQLLNANKQQTTLHKFLK